MAITKQDKQALAELHSEWSKTYGGRSEDYFPLLYLTKKFKTTVDAIAGQVCFGSNDYGIDAYYIDREARNLYLYQFKWSENHNLFKESLERLAADGIERIFGNAQADPNQNEVLNTLRAELHEYRSLIDRVLVHFVFKGELEATENSEGLANRRETLESKSHLLHAFFGRDDVELTVEFITDRRQPPALRPAESHPINFTEGAALSSADSAHVMHVGFVPLMDLVRIYRSLRERCLDRNIRSGLSPDNPPNRKIREALGEIVLKQSIPPDVFAFNHNGVTLAAEKIEFVDGRAILHVPRLLNGAQTITSVAKFVLDHDGHPALKGGGTTLESIKVLAKIVVADPSSEFVTNVTICNNRQNPVDAWNLRANDRIQCDLHDRLKEQVSVFYSRQENAFRNYSADELDEMGYDSRVQRDMRIRQLAQTFLATQGEIGRMSQLPEVFESQRLYGETFRESYLACDARKIVLAYKVGLLLKDPLQRLEEVATQKIRFAVSKARNLVWALLIQAILNDAKLLDLLEEYGTSLKKENGFREYLRKQASSKLLPILKEVLARPEHVDRMANEKYEFLRTKELFTQCKDAAYERFEWIKKSL